MDFNSFEDDGKIYKEIEMCLQPLFENIVPPNLHFNIKNDRFQFEYILLVLIPEVCIRLLMQKCQLSQEAAEVIFLDHCSRVSEQESLDEWESVAEEQKLKSIKEKELRIREAQEQKRKHDTNLEKLITEITNHELPDLEENDAVTSRDCTETPYEPSRAKWSSMPVDFGVTTTNKAVQVSILMSYHSHCSVISFTPMAIDSSFLSQSVKWYFPHCLIYSLIPCSYLWIIYMKFSLISGLV